MKPLQLSEHAGLFRDAAAYKEFVRILGSSLDNDELRVVFADSDIVCTVVSPDGIRDLMRHRILARFSEQPDLLDELRQRLEDTELVD